MEPGRKKKGKKKKVPLMVEEGKKAESSDSRWVCEELLFKMTLGDAVTLFTG